MLLLHGAHAGRTDQHGVTSDSEMLTRENGKRDTADVLKGWLGNENKDLGESRRKGQRGRRVRRERQTVWRTLTGSSYTADEKN
jgi:hypothetical protein